MKKVFTLLVLLCSALSAFAQFGGWTFSNASVLSSQQRYFPRISPTDANTCWAVVDTLASGTSVYGPTYRKTVDGGTTWHTGRIKGAVKLSPAQILALDSSTAFVPMFNQTTGGGKLFRTTNGGATWTSVIPTGFAAPAGFPDFVHFYNSFDGISVGDPNGGYFEIYRTSDGGTTWNRVAQASVPANQASEYGLTADYAAKGDSLWFGTTTGRIYRSFDKGATWNVATTPYTGKYVSSIAFESATVGFAVTSDTTAATIIKTIDGGATWAIDAGNTTNNLKGKSNIAYIPSTPASYFITSTGRGVAYTLDGGASWTGSSDQFGDNNFAEVRFNDPTSGWASGLYRGGGIFKSASAPRLLGTVNVSKAAYCYGDTTIALMAADTTNGAFSGLLVNARLYNDAGVRIDSVIRAPLANAGAGAFNAGNAGAPGTIILAYGSLFKNNNLSPLIEKLHFNVELFPTNNYAGRKTFDLYYKIGTLPDAANNYAGCAKVNSTTACSAALDLSTCQGTPPVLTYATTYTVNGGTAVAGSSFTATASGSYTVAFMFDNGTCTKMLNKTLTCTVGTESVQAFGKPMTVYPNPATDVLYFAPDASISELQIWDMTGKLVSAQRTTFAEEMATSTATLSKGMYQLITLDAAGNRLNYARFVKQ